jgi:uncharacterized protein (UPF0262 family)
MISEHQSSAALELVLSLQPISVLLQDYFEFCYVVSVYEMITTFTHSNNPRAIHVRSKLVYKSPVM